MDKLGIIGRLRQAGKGLATVLLSDDNPSTELDTTEEIDEGAYGEELEPVRFPWLRYADKPVRCAPPSATSTSDENNEPVADREQPQIRLQQPLLTEEELQALIGEDDIAAIAPQEHDDVDTDPRAGRSPNRD